MLNQFVGCRAYCLGTSLARPEHFCCVPDDELVPWLGKYLARMASIENLACARLQSYILAYRSKHWALMSRYIRSSSFLGLTQTH